MIPLSKKKIQLFNNLNNINKTINLRDSVYKYSYLYIEGDTDYQYVIVPIFSAMQSKFAGIGGWSGTSGNVGTTQIKGTISNNGKTLNIETFLSLVHSKNAMHQDSVELFCKKIIGIR